MIHKCNMIDTQDMYSLENIKSNLHKIKSHPGMYSPVLFKFDTSVDVSEFLTFFNVIRQKQIFRGVKILLDEASYKPTASKF